MNIEELLEQEKSQSIRLLKLKAGHLGEDFIEDVYCDARYKALKNINSYDPERPFKNWWGRILSNALVDKINQEKNEIPTEHIEEKHFDENRGINIRLTLSELEDMLDSLPKKQRDVLAQVLNEELNNKAGNIDMRKSSGRLALHKLRKKISHLI